MKLLVILLAISLAYAAEQQKPDNLPDGFDANGAKIRQCNRFSCMNPSVCSDPTGGSATCDTMSGQWVIPNDIDVLTPATLLCPLRIEGKFVCNAKLNVHGCANLQVTGVATFGEEASIVFDLDNYGTPAFGERIDWFLANTQVGNVPSYEFINIWTDNVDALGIVNQRCGNSYSLLFHAANQAAPGDNCDPNADSNKAVGDTSDAALSPSSPSSNASDVVPTYGIALLVLACLLLVALVVISVLLARYSRLDVTTSLQDRV